MPILDYLSPASLILAARKANKTFQYASAAAGIGGIVIVLAKYGPSYATIAFGSVVVLVVMVLFLVFSQAAVVAKTHFALPAAVLIWSFLILGILTAIALFSSAFLDIPLPLKSYIINKSLAIDPPPPPKMKHIVTSGIEIESTNYGGNCPLKRNVAEAVFQNVASKCSGHEQCQYLVNSRVIGDPSELCQKRFKIEYRCVGQDGPLRTVELEPEADGKTANLDCRKPPATMTSASQIVVVPEVSQANYGKNCNLAKSEATNHVQSWVQEKCAGKPSCSISVEQAAAGKIGDHCPGIKKDFDVTYLCGNQEMKKNVRGESSGETAFITCL